MTQAFSPFEVFAPAKVNLYLHVTGKRDNGYHDLDSLIGFADIGDRLFFSPSAEFQFETHGPYAGGFSLKEHDASPHSANIIVRSVWALARIAKKTPSLKITLEKNLPMGAGIGGGSSDAAAAIWGLCELWGLDRTAPEVAAVMLEMGADVPVCLDCRTRRIQGVGEVLKDVPEIGETPIVLIYPGKPCATPAVFKHFSGAFQKPIEMPDEFKNFADMIAFLKTTTNSLSLPASDHVPEIENVLNALNAHESCALARMTGSGSSCFGLFAGEEDAGQAAALIAQDNPDWWVKTGWLGRPERY